ncbi:MAG: Serine--glyoxylate aminotransferase [Candidatus Bipolaricaulis sibiricus]|uniref:Serine--glyoxylate aminotransferase n=1 Tax=Bipolaricaulis sibiricus TaxID=2501609 RepID=A0A410FV76_BIPS1|nr:MAG: Serine--glyoxylate aminotransferase [Candidatus Bipolaricaulis sibiricus]
MRNAHSKLFTPGPTEVRPEVLQAMAVPQIYHRSPEFRELYAEIQPKLQKLLYTQQPVLLFAASSTGVMEAAVQNCVGKRCLNLVNGAFSKRWHEITAACGIPCETLEVPWNVAIKPEMVEEKLRSGDYDAVTLVHNETSTGLLNPLREIAAVVRKFPDVLLLVDSVSGMGGVKIEFDALGIDVLLAGVQKALALPAGLAVCAVSERALKRAQQVKSRTYYFSFPVMMKSHAKNETPATPAIPHLFALNVQLDAILAEGLDRRFARHDEMAAVTQSWAQRHFAMYPEKGYWSKTVSCISNTREISVEDLNKTLVRDHGLRISNGYGDLKGKTFRIGHMGDHTVADVRGLLATIDAVLGL